MKKFKINYINIKHSIFDRSLAFALAGCMVGVPSFFINQIVSREKVQMVSTAMASSFYSKDNGNVYELDEDVVLDYENLRYSRDLLLENDEDITNKNLEKVKFLEIDARSRKDIECLRKYGKNIERIKVIYAEELNDNDVRLLSSLGLEEIELKFNVDKLFAMARERLDLSGLIARNIKISYDTIMFYNNDSNKEVIYLTIYNFINGKEMKQDFNLGDDDIELNKIRSLDGILDGIIDNINFDKNDNDEERLIKVLLVVENKINYDMLVQDYLMTKDVSVDNISSFKDIIKRYDDIKDVSKLKRYLKKEGDGLLSYYNDYPVSAILNKRGNNVGGICCNYAAMANLLCLKTGIESYLIDGWCYSNDATSYDDIYNVGHAWVLVRLNNKNGYFVVDPTRLDEDERVSETDLLSEGIFYNIDGSGNDFVYEPNKYFAYDEDGMLNKFSDDVVYCNKGLQNSIGNISMISGGFLGGTAISGVIYKRRVRKKYHD